MFSSDLEEIESYDNIYFVKYGRGGVIVILDNPMLEEQAIQFHKKEELDCILGRSNLLPIKKIYSSDSEVIVQFSLDDNTLVSRTFHKSQVTIEVFNNTEEA